MSTVVVKEPDISLIPSEVEDTIIISFSGVQGPKGDDGVAGGSASRIPIGEFIAAENIPSSSFVHISQSSGQIEMANRLGGKHAHGFTISAISSGETATIYATGQMTGLSGLTKGMTIWLSTSGTVTHSLPTSGIIQRVGEATSSTSCYAECDPHVVLAG